MQNSPDPRKAEDVVEFYNINDKSSYSDRDEIEILDMTTKIYKTEAKATGFDPSSTNILIKNGRRISSNLSKNKTVSKHNKKNKT
jgi:hypothetical protein